MIDLASTDIWRSERLDNKHRKNGLFDKLSLELVGSREVGNPPHILNKRKPT